MHAACSALRCLHCLTLVILYLECANYEARHTDPPSWCFLSHMYKYPPRYPVPKYSISAFGWKVKFHSRTKLGKIALCWDTVACDVCRCPLPIGSFNFQNLIILYIVNIYIHTEWPQKFIHTLTWKILLYNRNYWFIQKQNWYERCPWILDSL